MFPSGNIFSFQIKTVFEQLFIRIGDKNLIVDQSDVDGTTPISIFDSASPVFSKLVFQSSRHLISVTATDLNVLFYDYLLCACYCRFTPKRIGKKYISTALV